MGSIFVIQGLLIYIYAFDHNPPHIHVRSGSGDFTITLKDRIVEGRAKSPHRHPKIHQTTHHGACTQGLMYI